MLSVTHLRTHPTSYLMTQNAKSEDFWLIVFAASNQNYMEYVNRDVWYTGYTTFLFIFCVCRSGL